MDFLFGRGLEFVVQLRAIARERESISIEDSIAHSGMAT